jgi:hypothetical protein
MIVTSRHPRRRSSFPDVPDMTPEEHKRRDDAADALFRELTRRVRDVGAWEPALATVARSCGQVGAEARRSTDPLFRHAGLDLDHE